jgi:hypothetical protein
VQGEFIYCIFLKTAQTAQLTNHHQVSGRVDRFAKCAPADELANAQSGKVGVLPELHAL